MSLELYEADITSCSLLEDTQLIQCEEHHSEALPQYPTRKGGEPESLQTEAPGPNFPMNSTSLLFFALPTHSVFSNSGILLLI